MTKVILEGIRACRVKCRFDLSISFNESFGERDSLTTRFPSKSTSCISNASPHLHIDWNAAVRDWPCAVAFAGLGGLGRFIGAEERLAQSRRGSYFVGCSRGKMPTPCFMMEMAHSNWISNRARHLSEVDRARLLLWLMMDLRGSGRPFTSKHHRL